MDEFWGARPMPSAYGLRARYVLARWAARIRGRLLLCEALSCIKLIIACVIAFLNTSPSDTIRMPFGEPHRLLFDELLHHAMI